MEEGSGRSTSCTLDIGTDDVRWAGDRTVTFPGSSYIRSRRDIAIKYGLIDSGTMDDGIDMGAEAVISYGDYLGRPAVIKTRPKKGYRHPELDRNLRSHRTRNEAKVMRDARTCGVRTPVIYDVDHHEGTIVMERMFGRKVRDIIDNEPDSVHDVCVSIGEAVAKLHNGRISHGDLTTSNMILTDSGELCIIDFSLGSVRCEIEEMGVDLRLLERAFSSAHSRSETAFGTILESYGRNMERSKEVLKRVEIIKNRARYT